MAQEWFDRWAVSYATTFGLRDEDLKMVLSWYSIFHAANYTEAELNQATQSIAGDPAGLAKAAGEARFLGRAHAHLGAIHASIREQRAVLYRRESEECDRLGTCDLCGGSGRVVVPLVTSEMSGEWRPLKISRGGASYYTMAVTCRCAIGNWFRHHTQSECCPMSLESYERMNRNWPRQLQLREREHLLKIEHRPHDHSDGRLDAVLARVCAQYAIDLPLHHP